MKRGTRKRRRRSGNVAIEYGLILPAFLLFVIGIIDVGRLLWTYTTLARAVEAAARCGAIDVNNCATTTQIQTRAVSEAWGLTVTTADFTVSSASCGIEVTGTYNFVWAIPAVVSSSPFGTLALSARGCYSPRPVP